QRAHPDGRPDVLPGPLHLERAARDDGRPDRDRPDAAALHRRPALLHPRPHGRVREVRALGELEQQPPRGTMLPAFVLARPATPGPHPAAVHAPGHWMENARLEPDLQRFNIRLALAGIAVLCYDPIGQGERRSGWHEHGQLAPLPAGFTSLGVMVADTLAGL